MIDDDEIVFVEEDEGIKPQQDSAAEWIVLIVDDEPDVHHVTQFAMKGFSYQERKVNFKSLFSGAEVKEYLEKNPAPALILLDVVMEEKDSGFKVVKFIREQQNNHMTQIILRTGQPGEAPEEEAIQKYHINDYKLKTELTREKLFSSITFSLRAFADLTELESIKTELEDLNKNLESKVSDRTKELNEKNESLRESLHENRNLLRVISHDLNNYLSVDMASARIGLRMTNLDEKLKAQWERVLRAGQSQVDLVDHVVNLEAYKSGKKVFVAESVKLADILRMMKFAFEDKILHKEINLMVDFTCDPDIYVMVDPTPFLNSVINNVMSNAIKFSEHGGDIKVTIAQKGNDVLIGIRDYGIGIPKKLLREMYSVDVKTTRLGTEGERGTGFGMPLVKSYLEKMNGSIEVISVTSEFGPDHGTTITISVPKASAPK